MKTANPIIGDYRTKEQAKKVAEGLTADVQDAQKVFQASCKAAIDGWTEYSKNPRKRK